MAAAAIAVLAVALAACNAISPASQVPGTAGASLAASPTASPVNPSPSSSKPAVTLPPSPSATPTPPPKPKPGTQLPVGIYAAGTYSSVIMRPNVTLTLPEGFQLRAEETDYLWFSIGAENTAPEIAVMRPNRTSVVDALTRRSDIKPGKPFNVTVAGIKVRAIDLSLAATAALGAKILNTAVSTNFIFPPGTQGRLFELQVQGVEVVILYDAPEFGYPSFQQVAEQIVASLQFPA